MPIARTICIPDSLIPLIGKQSLELLVAPGGRPWKANPSRLLADRAHGDRPGTNPSSRSASTTSGTRGFDREGTHHVRWS
jgi:hypothetical protein